jgi:hypothetical protein
MITDNKTVYLLDLKKDAIEQIDVKQAQRKLFLNC